MNTRYVLAIVACCCLLVNTAFCQVKLQVNGFERSQRMHGIGVNVNSRSWKGDELKPAFDLLLDSMGSRVVRLIVETPIEWEDVNDNDDPFSFNWRYYDSLYETPKFTKAWESMAYLNRKGVDDELIINFMGYLPEWLGGETIKPGYEDEFVEMLVSFFYYAKNKRHLKFGLVSPTNESDWQKEGPRLDEKRWVTVMQRLIKRMDEMGMGDVKYVGPDPANMMLGVTKYIPAILKDSLIMSKMAHFGVHSYGGYYAHVDSVLKNSAYPASDFWVTEWNAWRDGLDDGKIGVYDYTFAEQCMVHLFDLLKHGATAAIVWEGYDSYYDHHAPSLFSYWGILGYNKQTGVYAPRKHLYAISQVSKYVKEGAWQVGLSGGNAQLKTLAFYHPELKEVVITGANTGKSGLPLQVTLANVPEVSELQLVYTDSLNNLKKSAPVKADKNGIFYFKLPARCIFTLHGQALIKHTKVKPEPANWYAGDVHVHRNCGDGFPVFSMDTIRTMMEHNNLSVISMLADMGNGEVKNSKEDLLRVNGKNDPMSAPGRIIHWDAEWHWDAIYSQFSNQALGGHLMFLGLEKAEQVWEESTYKVLEWGRKNGALTGFCHLQYLDGKVQNSLNCCIPLELPVEAALGTLDFVSLDVYGSHSPNQTGYYFNEESIGFYYKLLNCGIRLPLTAGTDFPCNSYEPLGTLLTYVYQEGTLTYKKWLEGIRKGRTVISRMGHNEFLDLKINKTAMPGDQIAMKEKGKVQITVQWNSVTKQEGSIEIVANGKVIGAVSGVASPGKPLLLDLDATVDQHTWITARRTGGKYFHSHTSPVYVTVGGMGARADKESARFFVKWIDNLLVNTSPGGPWHHYFPKDLAAVQERYRKAKAYYSLLLSQP